MKQNLLNKSTKLFLTLNDIANELSINKESAKVTANRYTKSGSLIRIKRNFYITESRFKKLKESEIFQIANFIEVPSYISLTTALSYYGITTQQSQSVIESVSLKRTKTLTIKNIEFRFFKVKKSFYSGFDRTDNFFIAEPEKAFADALYLTAIGKYSFDLEAINFKKLNVNQINFYLENSNLITIKFWNKLCKRFKI
jgi:predicted transcriptional regulator of viral defense system